MRDWLLDSDPSIRWHVLGDPAERSRIASEGWGAQLLALRGEDGFWAGGALFPANWKFDRNEGQPWIATEPTLTMLRLMGVDPDDQTIRETIAAVRDNCRWEHAGQAFFAGEVEPCINGRAVALGAYFGENVDGIVTRLVAEQLEDGGWNCEAENGSVRSSFDTTINVLEGLLLYERSGGAVDVVEARRRGDEYLLERRLFRRKSTGEVVKPSYLEFSFPNRWHYDVLRGLDYFREAGGPPDPRMD